jgi:acyl-CoA reductase-like NAD-dependent aldehyde dehydrogenase
MKEESRMASVDVLDDVTKWLATPPQMTIAGRGTPSSSGATFDVIDPSTGQTITEVPRGDRPDIEAAVAAARAAFEDRRWSGLRPGKRAELLFKLGELIKRNIPALSQLESLDSGKPIKLASGEIWAAGEVFR